ncbi:MAG: hypothetical protein ACPGXK_05255, partial [Phycisphaerae bacterium]
MITETAGSKTTSSHTPLTQGSFMQKRVANRRFNGISGALFVGAIAGFVLAGGVSRLDAAPSAIRGDRVTPEGIGESFIESMDVVLERDRLAKLNRIANGERNAKANPDRRYGQWVVPNRRGSVAAHSGRHYITNEWGDTRMGIGFPELVDVHGFYLAGQMNDGVWPGAIRVLGFANGREIAKTDWHEAIDGTPSWFEVDLCDVDRIVIQARAAVNGGGWYAIDDLTYSPKADADQAQTVIDFDDLDYASKLTGTRYAGLSWEFGTGFDFENIVPAPQMPPGFDDKPAYV